MISWRCHHDTLTVVDVLIELADVDVLARVVVEHAEPRWRHSHKKIHTPSSFVRARPFLCVVAVDFPHAERDHPQRKYIGGGAAAARRQTHRLHDCYMTSYGPARRVSRSRSLIATKMMKHDFRIQT